MALVVSVPIPLRTQRARAPTRRKAFLRNYGKQKSANEHLTQTLKKKHLQISSKKIKIKQYPDYVMKIQYSTKKSFKKAKTVSNKGRLVRAIKKLKRNTTYYIRYCSNTVVDTDAGQKSVYGQWSKTLKVRTKG